jgi:outer membrane receptor protein involved in Fe transport
MRFRHALLLFWCVAGVCAVPAASAQQPQDPPAAPPKIEEQVDVVGITPVHGTGLPTRLVPANVQVFTAGDIDASRALDTPSFLSGRAVSVQVSEAQGGTFQPDLVFRGFVASPLLGASEGLAVYLDGVRMNDPFGDIVAWDILPTSAVASINVVPGSNPLFGLNALGGSLSLRTKDGFAFPRQHVSYTTGAFGRHRVEAESGAHGGSFGYFVAGTLTRESGWRDFSPSTVRRLFGDLAWRGQSSTLNVSILAASNDVTGNGAAPVALLEADRDAVFTYPDETANDLAMVTLKGRRQLRPQLQFDGVAYYRRSTLRTFNGDDADDDDDDEFEFEDDEEDEVEFDAANNISRTRGHGAGMTGQLTHTETLAGRASHLVVGAGVDASTTRFDFATELAQLTPARGTIGSGLFDEDAYVDLHTRTLTGSAFVSETWSLSDRVALSGAARFNWTSLRLRDQLGVELDGDHSFARLNPSAGVTYQARPWMNVYASYAESSRVPTPVEVTCADPEDPCRLPNAFVSDPPLDQIVARTWEAGARGSHGPVRWASAFFRSAATDDIVFVSSGTLRGEGHFENIERTNRTGLEATFEYEVRERFTGFAGYTLQRAAFGTDLRVASGMHPGATGGEIAVSAGDRLPAVPVHAGTIGMLVTATERLRVGADLRAQSGLILRGDEANLLPEVPGFARVDARAAYRLTSRLTVVGQVHNILDAEYATFGVLGDPSLLGTGSTDHRFYSPGEPRAAWVGIELQF